MRVHSKPGNYLGRFDQLCYWVREELGARDVILDGEVVALDEHGRQDVRGLMAGKANLSRARKARSEAPQATQGQVQRSASGSAG